MIEYLGDDRVTGLVISCYALVGIGDDATLLLRTGDDLVDALEDVLHDDDLAPRSRGEDSRLVEQVFKISAAEPAGHARKYLKRDVRCERFVAAMHFEDLLPALDVGDIDVDLPVETPGSEQRGIENVRPVGRRHHYDAVVLFKAVHLYEQLVERLLSLVMAAAKSRASLPSDGVDLVDKDDAGHITLRLVEQIAHSRGARTDKHLDKVGSADREERHVALARNRLGKQRLARARRTDEQHTLGDTRADSAEFLRIFEEVYNLFEFLLFFLRARDVAETDGHVHAYSRLGLAEVHRLFVGARALSEDDEQHDAHDDQHDRREDKRRPAHTVIVMGRDLGHDKVGVALGIERIDIFKEHAVSRQFRDIVGVGCRVGFELIITHRRVLAEDIRLRTVDDVDRTGVAFLYNRSETLDFVARVGDRLGFSPSVEHEPQQHYEQHYRNSERDEFDYGSRLF